MIPKVLQEALAFYKKQTVWWWLFAFPAWTVCVLIGLAAISCGLFAMFSSLGNFFGGLSFIWVCGFILYLMATSGD